MQRYTKQLLLFSHQVVSHSFATTWTVAHQAPLSTGFLRQEYWSGLPFPPPRDTPPPRDQTHISCLAGGFVTSEPPGKTIKYIIQFKKVVIQVSTWGLVTQSCLTLSDHMDYPWDSPGKNTGVGCHSLLQSNFPNQRSNPRLPHYSKILYYLSYQGIP